MVTDIFTDNMTEVLKYALNNTDWVNKWGYTLKQICHELITETSDGFMQIHYTFQFTSVFKILHNKNVLHNYQ